MGTVGGPRGLGGGRENGKLPLLFPGLTQSRPERDRGTQLLQASCSLWPGAGAAPGNMAGWASSKADGFCRVPEAVSWGPRLDSWLYDSG